MKRSNTIRYTLAAALTAAILLAGYLWLNRPAKRVVKYVGYMGRYTNLHDTLPADKRTPNKFDTMHEIVLRDQMAELTKRFPGYEFRLKTYDCGQDAAVGDSVYRTQIAPDTNVIAVVDNTWGVHIRGCAATIRAQGIPVIAINADKNGLDFGPTTVFTGNNDNIPLDLTAFLKNVLHQKAINFISESDYPLHASYLKAFSDSGIAIERQILALGKSPDQATELAKVTAQLKQITAGRQPGDSLFWVLNVHGNLGTKILQYIDSALDGMNLIGHAYVVDLTSTNNFGAERHNRLILITNPTDAMSEQITLAREGYLKSNPELFGNYNMPLFIKRCHDAAELVSNAVAARRDSGALTRSDVGRYFAALGNAVVKGSDELYQFNADRELAQDILFSELKQGKLVSYHRQLNARRQVIPTLVFGLDILDVYDVEVSNNSFKADFYYWVKMDTSETEAEKFILFQNMKASESTRELVFQKVSGGTLYKLYKVSGLFHVGYDLHDYPFDSQQIIISMEVLNPSDKLKIAFDQSGFQRDKNILERFRVRAWDKLKYYITVDNRITSTVRGDPDGRDGDLKKFQSFAFRLYIKRNVQGPFLEIVLPLILIGMVAVSLLYIRDISFENLGEVSVGTFLGIITFSIALSNITPSSDYLTKADYLFWLTFLMVLVNFMTVIVMNSLYDLKDLRAERIKPVRWAATILYPVAVAWVLLM